MYNLVMRLASNRFANLALACVVLTLNACSLLPSWHHGEDLAPREVVAVAPDPNAPRHAALATRYYENISGDVEILGDVQILFTHQENTFADLARFYDLGYQGLRHANPEVDAWLPGDGTPVYLPTMHVLPAAPRDGIVINLPSMRLLYFQASETSEQESSVSSHPIGIGREGWSTPTGDAVITAKARQPTWYPPASVRAEHEELGDPLPAIVPPGPDNPLGAYTMKLSIPGYLIHGTNKPAGVGMRVSHGCVRLYPEDIETLFDDVPLQTPVYIVDQPVLAGWRDDRLYLEVHRPLVEDARDLQAEAERVVALALGRRELTSDVVDAATIEQVVAERRGIPFPISLDAHSPDRYLAAARIIENTVPIRVPGATASR